MIRPRPTDRHGPGWVPSAAPTSGQVLVGRGLSIRIYERAGWSIVQIEGEFDLQSNPLRRRVIDATSSWIVFDLHHVSFMDARGLSMLAAGLRHAYQNGGSVRIAAAPHHALKLLTITQMDQHIPVFNSLLEALASPK